MPKRRTPTPPSILTHTGQLRKEELPEAPAEDVPEEARHQLEQWMRQKEEAWIDEPIPALGGMTPRQAVADPTRREDLLSLLRSLERAPEMPANAMGFDPDRLRTLLGVEEE